MDLGGKIKELRKRKGMSQVDLGMSIGICSKTISDWEHKKYNPTREHVKKLEKVLGEPLSQYKRVSSSRKANTSDKEKELAYEANKRVDVGKIGALYRAGWKIDKIARDVRVSEEEVVKYLRGMKVDGQRERHYKNNSKNLRQPLRVRSFF